MHNKRNIFNSKYFEKRFIYNICILKNNFQEIYISKNWMPRNINIVIIIILNTIMTVLYMFECAYPNLSIFQLLHLKSIISMN